MAFYYECSEFKSKKDNNNMSSLVSKQIEKLKQYKDIRYRPRHIVEFANNLFVFKYQVKGENSHIVIQEIKDKQFKEPLYLLRDFYPSSEYSRYKTIVYPELEKGIWNINKNDEQNALDSYKNYLKTVEIKPKLDLWIRDLLNETSKYKFDIFETEEWVKGIKTLKHYQSSINSIIKDIIDVKIDFEDFKKLGNRTIYKLYKNSILILFELDKNDNMLLDFVCEGENPNNNILEKIFQYEFNNFNEIAIKAYRKIDLNNVSFWINSIENESDSANLSLNPEQIISLESMEMPKFINGQAGSGKSTLLYYLFADFYFQKINQSPLIKIIFLTENSALLNNSRQQIINILKNNPSFKEDSKTLSGINECFTTFKDFIFENFEIEEEYDYYDYTKFRKEYTNFISRQKKKFSPELAWYVISTIIKGYEKNKIINPSDLPDSFFESYKIEKNDAIDIYDNVWIPFYSKKVGVDKYDIIRKILQEYEKFSFQFTVIFCDETQDLTNIEIELLTKFSIFYNKDLDGIEKIPIYFAGDPLQTVTPTGFNIKKIKDLLYNIFKSEDGFNFTIKHQIIDNLLYNYRSSEKIVDLANLIQFYRKCALNEDIDMPQKVKLSNITMPYFLEQTNTLIEQIKFADIIIPCELGEESEYLDNLNNNKNSFLSEIHDIKQYIKSSAAVKGLEFKKVIVYGFGEYYLNEINKLNWAKNESNFKEAYFFNKLYVAITRAKEELYIIENGNGKEFWNQLCNSASIYDLKLKYNKWDSIKTEVIDYTNCLEVFKPIIDINDYKEITEEYFEKGCLLHDIEKLNNAKVRYEKLLELTQNNEYNLKKSETIALISEIECKWEQAGDIYLTLNTNEFIEKAIKSYWIGGCWEKLNKVSSTSIKYQINLFMLKPNENSYSFIYDSNFLMEIESFEFKDKLKWKPIFYNNLFNRIDTDRRNFTISQSHEYADILEKIEIYKFERKFLVLIAILYTNAEKYDLANKFWDKNSDLEINNSEIKKMYAFSKFNDSKTNIDDKIHFGFFLGKFIEIINLYSHNTSINIHSQNLIFKSFILSGKYEDALKNKLPIDYDLLLEQQNLYGILITLYQFTFNQVFKLENNFVSFAKKLINQKFKDKSSLNNNKRFLIQFIKILSICKIDFTIEKSDEFDRFARMVTDLYKENLLSEINNYEFISLIERCRKNYLDILTFFEKNLKIEDNLLKNDEFNKFIQIRYLKVNYKKFNFDLDNSEKLRKARQGSDFGDKIAENFEKSSIEKTIFNDAIEKINKDYISFCNKRKINQIYKSIKEDEIEKTEKTENLPVIFEYISPKINNENKEEYQRLLKYSNTVLDLFKQKYKESNNDTYKFLFKTNLNNLFDIENDHLKTSFWSGYINENTFYISVLVYLNGTFEIILNSENKQNLIVFLKKIAKRLNFNNLSENKWTKKYVNSQQNDFDKRLSENLNELIYDKNIIDIVLGVDVSDNLDLYDGLNFISEKEFNEILSYSEKKEIKSDDIISFNINRFKLKKVSIENIGIFDNIDIEFHDRLTCIIGENGSGKSTILSALALVLSGCKHEIIQKNLNRIYDKLKIVNSQTGKKRYAEKGKIILEYEGNKTYTNSILYDIQDSGGVIYPSISEEGAFAYRNNDLTFNCLILGFNQGFGAKYDSSPFFESIYNKSNTGDLFSLISFFSEDRLTSIKSWLDFNFKQSQYNKENRKIIDKVFKITSMIVSKKEDAFVFIDRVVDEKKQDFYFTVKTLQSPNGIPLELISQGLNNIFTWIGYIVKRMYDVYPDYKDENNEINPCKAPAIILIDEIDTYLHPQWQSRILKVLMSEFSNTQFIISTHSAVVLEGLEKGQIARLFSDDSGKISVKYNETDIWAWAYSDILEHFHNQNIDYSKYDLLKITKMYDEETDNEIKKELQNKIYRIEQSQLARDQILELQNDLNQRIEKYKKLIKEFKPQK